jgi:surface antigen
MPHLRTRVPSLGPRGGGLLLVAVVSFVGCLCLSSCGTRPSGIEKFSRGAASKSIRESEIDEAQATPAITAQSGTRVMAAPGAACQPGGVNVRDQALDTVLFAQCDGEHGTVEGSETGTAGGFTGTWWEISWDSEPPNQDNQLGWSADSVIALAPTAGDVAEPDFSGSNYTSNNVFWQDGYAPNESPNNLGGAIGNCTWYAFGRILDLGANQTTIGALIGNADQWPSEAAANGIPVDTNPTVHSIAELDADTGFPEGHLAIVESINSDGTITVTESSAGLDPTGNWMFLWRHRTVSPSWFSQFIHLPLNSGTKITPTVTLSPSTSIITNTQALTETVALSGASGSPIPTGTVTLSAAGFTSSPVTLTGGSATITIPADTLSPNSSYLLTATYSGDNNYDSATGTGSVTVNPATKAIPVVMLAPSSSTIASTQSLTEAITVSSSSSGPTPTGSVMLSAAGFVSSAAPLTNGSASIIIPGSTFAPNSSYQLTATYSGDTNYSSATGTGSVTVNLAATTPTLSSINISPTNAVSGATVQVTLALSAAAPSGGAVVTLSSSNSSAFPVPSSFTVPAGQTSASFSNQTGNVASTTSVTVTASYNGTSKVAQVGINPVIVSSLSISPTTVTSDSTATLTIQLNESAPAAGALVTLNSNNTRAFPVPSSFTVAAGQTSGAFSEQAGTVSSSTTVMVTAGYNGYSQQAQITVNPTSKLTPTVTVIPSSNSIVTTQVLSVTVSVEGDPTPTGTVTLSGGGYTGPAATLMSGSATIDVPAESLTTGAEVLMANYSGDSTYNPAIGETSIVVDPPPSFSLSASPTTISVAQGSSGNSTITVSDVGGFSGAVTLVATGLPTGVTASFASGSASGSQVVTLATSSSAQITSSPVTVTVTGMSGALSATTSIALIVTALPTFTAGSGGTTSITNTPGTSSTGTISVLGTNGFAGTVSLTCSVVTAMMNVSDTPSCSLSPTSLALSGTTDQTSTLTVTTTAASSAMNSIRRFFSPAGGSALALVMLIGVRRRILRRLTLAALLVLCFLIPLVGCGGGSSGNGGGPGNENPGTTAGTYTISVTGTSGTINATVATITLTVE